MIIYLVFLGWAALLAQMTLPRFDFLEGASPDLLPLVIIYAALRLRGPSTFIVTLLIGWSFDLLTPNRLGIGVVACSLLAALILTQAQSRAARHLLFAMLLVLVGSFLFFGIDYLLHRLQVWRWTWSPAIWTTMAFNAGLNAALTPILFPLFDLVPKLLNWGDYGSEERTTYAR